MNNITFENLINNIKMYNPKGLEIVKKAYEYADVMHSGQSRQSGEPYIIHPLNVAYILSEMHADIDTICAGLLHDTLEDTNATKEEIFSLFNEDVATLVDGVTKMRKMNFSSKTEQNMANTRKIITSIMHDARIIIIKLADRLHNMRTLEFKSEFKQRENAIETMEIFAPLAYYMGAYRIKNELEDLSLMYLKPYEYKVLQEEITRIQLSSNSCINEMLININEMLNNEFIPHEIKVRIKNIYGVYKRLYRDNKIRISEIDEMHDLISLKIMVDEIKNCYVTLGLIHSKYNPLNSSFKDYIYNPKVNLYRSIHTTVFGPSDKLIQAQIRTFDMDKIASFGITTNWDNNSENVRERMQNELCKKFEIYKSLTDINNIFKDNVEFVSHVKSELFSDTIYVYAENGGIVELPLGATIVDLAYKLGDSIGNGLVGAKVNDKFMDDVGYELKNDDRVIVLTDNKVCNSSPEWLCKARTSYAKSKIKELIKK